MIVTWVEASLFISSFKCERIKEANLGRCIKLGNKSSSVQLHHLLPRVNLRICFWLQQHLILKHPCIAHFSVFPAPHTPDSTHRLIKKVINKFKMGVLEQRERSNEKCGGYSRTEIRKCWAQVVWYHNSMVGSLLQMKDRVWWKLCRLAQCWSCKR